MINQEKKWEEKFETFFNKEAYILRFSLVPPKVEIDKVVKEWMKEAYLQACRDMKEEIEGLKNVCLHCGLAISHGRRIGDKIISPCPVFAKKEAK